MKRVLLSITATIVGLVALLSFKAQGHPLTSAGGLPSAALPAPSVSSTSTGPTAKASTTTSAPPKAGASASASASRTVSGTAINTRYGVVQIQVNLTGARIDNVSFLQLTAFDRRSEDINSQAAPILLQETLSAQSAQIDSVSGASYTSDGYIQSLQSALDKAGIR